MSELLLASPAAPIGIPEHVKLHSTRGGTIEIDGAITDGELMRTMSGASTISLTVHDPHRKLLRNPMLVRGPGQLGYVDMLFDGVYWRMVKVEKQGDSLMLTFEDRAVAYLRRHTAPRKATRGTDFTSGPNLMTRAEFAASLVFEVKEGGGIGFYSPDMHKVQPVAPITNKRKKKKGNKPAQHAKGIPLDRYDLTIGDARSSPMQLRNVNRVLDVAYSLNTPPKAVLALVEACIVESRCMNSSKPSADGYHSRGILQVQDATARGLHISNLEIEQCAHAFLTRGFWTDPKLGGGGAIAIALRHPNVSAGAIAQATQGSAYPTRYEQHKGEAVALLSVYDPGLLDVNWNPSSGSSSKKTTRQVAQPYQFRRGGADGTIEDSWETLQRLAQEVSWRCFCDRDVVYFVSDDTLMTAQPLLVIRESMATVIELDFDIDRGKANLGATLVVHGSRWLGGPGMVVELKDCGPADGRWLIDTIRRPLADSRTEITLTAPGEATLEPAPETSAVPFTPDEPGATGAGGGGGGGAVKPYETPKQIIDRHVLPIARKWGMTQGIDPATVAARNASHGATVTGSRSDHQGPPTTAWAVDMSNGFSPTVQMDALAAELAKKFGIPWSGSGLANHTRGLFRYQLIYRTFTGGNHFNHVHFGVRRIASAPAGALGPVGP